MFRSYGLSTMTDRKSPICVASAVEVVDDQQRHLWLQCLDQSCQRTVDQALLQYLFLQHIQLLGRCRTSRVHTHVPVRP